MALPLHADVFAQDLRELPRTPASEVKKSGWRGVMRTIRVRGKTVVTNHDEPEAVIIPVAEYTAMVEKLRQAEARNGSALDELRQRFDERLAALQAPDAGDRLRAVMQAPVKLAGKVKAGSGH